MLKTLNNLTEYSDNCSEILESLWQYHKDEPALTDAGTLDDFPGKSTLFQSKQKITGSTGNYGTKAVQIMVPSRYLCRFWRELLKCH